MKKITRILMLVTILTILFIRTGYTTSNLTSSQIEFKIRFSEAPIVSNEEKVMAAITNDINATINVSGLKQKGEFETATYTVKNASIELAAELSVKITNDNKEYFLVDYDISKTTIKKGETTIITVKVELIKTPITETERATIGIQLEAEPIQERGNSSPNKDDSPSNSSSSSNNKNNSNSKDKEYGYYEKDETPKTGKFKLIEIFGR